jgi:hypothetical protein
MGHRNGGSAQGRSESPTAPATTDGPRFFRPVQSIVQLTCLSFAGAIDLLLGYVIENQPAVVAALGNTQIGNDYRERSAIFEPLPLLPTPQVCCSSGCLVLVPRSQSIP